MRPFITLVLIPTAGHMERAKRNIGFSFRIPLDTNWKFVFVVAGNVFPSEIVE
jgi:hypothetical protein